MWIAGVAAFVRLTVRYNAVSSRLFDKVTIKNKNDPDLTEGCFVETVASVPQPAIFSLNNLSSV